MISLNMIVGPYKEPFLEAAIESVFDLCDEFIFIDTAPGNNPNREILDSLERSLPVEDVHIIDMPRGEDKDFSFSEARELARTNSHGDWFLRLDADEVIHEDDVPTLRALTENTTCSGIEVYFYHFMIYPWLYQYIENKVILMRTDSYSWIGGVHELARGSGKIESAKDIRYYHYGYCRGQEEVFKRWQLYVDIDGRPDWYQGQDPAHILDDRLSVCLNFRGTHPLAVQPTLIEMFGDIDPFAVDEIPRMYTPGKYAAFYINDDYNAEVKTTFSRWKGVIYIPNGTQNYLREMVSMPEVEWVGALSRYISRLDVDMMKMCLAKDGVAKVESKSGWLMKRGTFLQIGIPETIEKIDALIKREGWRIEKI